MKNKNLNSIFAITFFLLIAPLLLISQSGNESRKIPIGERPPIDFSTVPQDAYYQGVIYVKFKPEAENFLNEKLIQASRNQTVQLGIEELDELNVRFGITEYKSLIHELYIYRSQNPEKIEQHREWGFHLWYALTFENEVELLELVREFTELEVVEFAEPVFKIMPVLPADIREVAEEEIKSVQRMSPNDQFYGLQWGFKNTGQSIQGTNGTPGADISAEAAWEIVTGNPDVIVAVIDDGIQFNHPDLEDNMWPNIGPEGSNTTPGNHGSHVAGTVAASSNNSIGVAGTAGGDGSSGSGVNLMSIDIFNGNHGMNNLQLNIYAADNGAAISQNSWSYTISGVYNQVDLDGIDYFNEHGGGNVMDGGISIFAAGNSNNNNNWYPAYYSGTMAVASTNNQDKKSSFSNFGTWVDISAPGTDIASTGGGSNYMWMSGTSMACPHVSGVAALLLSQSPGTLTNQQLWDLLVENTDDIDPLNPNHAGQLGTGRLNAFAALEALISGQGSSYTIVATTGPNGSINPSGDVSVPEGSDRTFTISPNPAYVVEDVLVDGSSVGAVTSYTFTNVTEDHTIHATFEAAPQYTITATAGPNGSISPLGDVSVTQGFDQSFSISPDPGFVISDVIVNGNSIGAVSSYTFTNVQGPHTIEAEFTGDPCNVSSLPYSESFNNQGIPNCWSTSALTGGLTWQQGSFNGGLSGSNNYVYARATGNNAQSAELLSPSFDFSNYSGVNLQFTHYYNHFRSSASLSYSTNGGSNWTTVQSWNSSTSNPAAFNQTINGVSGQSNVIFKWTFTFEGGGNPNSSKSWSIDDVLITSDDPLVQYEITATAGAGGSISPSGVVVIDEGSNQTFSISANSGFEIEDVVVDGSSVGAVSSYTFSNVSQNHTISATFSEQEPLPKYEITATAGAGGSISPSGVVVVDEGSNQTFAISASSGYEIEDVLVDGSSVGAVSSYTFSNVSQNHTISASFSEVEVGDCIVSGLPYLEDFDSVSDIPECWDADIASGSGDGWLVGTFSGGLNGTTGDYAYCRVNGNTAINANLYSIEFDLSNYTDINISFTHFYQHFRSTATFYYSTNGGSQWTQVQSWNSSTSNPTNFSQSISQLAGQSSVIFRWNFNFTGGGNPNAGKSWSVDDFEVTGNSQGQNTVDPGTVIGDDLIEKDLEILFYPNPARSEVYLKFNQDIEEAQISLINSNGQLLRDIQLMDIKADKSYPINLGDNYPGFLFLKVNTGSEIEIKRLIRME